jgi:hypothetical protein
MPAAWLAAAVFAVHPVHVESVAWITELKNVESVFFYLLALLAWMTFVEPPPGVAADRSSLSNAKRRQAHWPYYALAVVAYLLALFAKTTACTLPAAMVLIVWLRRRRITFATAFQILPFVIIGVGMGALSIWWEGNLGSQRGTGFIIDVYSASNPFVPSIVVLCGQTGVAEKPGLQLPTLAN